MYEIVIVGSGISGVAAALRFTDRGMKPCVVDVGIESNQEEEIADNFYSYRRKHDCFSLMIGENYEGLNNMDPRSKPIPVKLVSPRMRFVTAHSEEFTPVDENDFHVVQSFAQGGLANAWGAGLYRYNDRDLKDIPIRESDLTPYYDRLSAEIGISGENDDLVPYFGRDEFLQKPLKLSKNASRILKNYYKKKKKLNEKGAYLGRPRLGVLSEKKEGRSPCDYSNLEFWQPHLSYVYNPSSTLNRLIKEDKVVYKKGLLVKSWGRQDNNLIIQAYSLKERKTTFIRCKKLVLAGGSINSAKLALNSRKDYQTQLTLLDNPSIQFPFVLPSRIGDLLEVDAFGLTQLNFIYDSRENHILYQGSLLEITSPARAEFFSNFPLTAFDNLRLIRYILPALVVLQLFLPASRDSGASLRLDENGMIRIKGRRNHFDEGLIRDVIKLFRKLGCFTISSLIVKVPNGHSLHYAGTLPMVDPQKKEYTCSKFGELYGEPEVYVVDGGLFPVLPAKNCSFAVMANSMRIADFIVNTIRS